MVVVYIFLLVCIFACLIFKSKRYLHMLQQNLYNENNRYLKWVFRNSKQFLDLDLIALLVTFVGLFVAFDLEKLSMILVVAIGIILLVLAYLWKMRLQHDQNKKPLVITKRVRRLIVTTSILYLIPVVFLFIQSDDLQFAWIMITVLMFMICLNPFVVFLANIINFPIERGVYHYYKHQAQTKLKNMPNLKIIGITGSYGKTSSKNILSDILNIKWNMIYDFENKKFIKRLTISEHKTGKINIIPINDNLSIALQKFFSKQNPQYNDYIFTKSTDHTRPLSHTQAYRIIKTSADKCNITGNISCHSLRKTFGFFAWKQGTQPALLMAIYNHSSYNITKRYLRITQCEKDDIYAY